MTIDPRQPDRPVAHNAVKIGRRREAPEPPAFLIPPAPDDPFAVGIFRCIGLDLGLRLFKRARI